MDIPSVELNKTFFHKISNVGFADIPEDNCCEMFKNATVFSPWSEVYIAKHYPLKHVKGCKTYDHEDQNNKNIRYEQRTFTKKYGCNLVPSYMKGSGRSVDIAVYEKHAENLIFCIVSNANFPNIMVRFVKGIDLIKQWKKGNIPKSKHNEFFQNVSITESYQNLTLPNLKIECKKVNINSSGRKNEIIQRLVEYRIGHNWVRFIRYLKSN